MDQLLFAIALWLSANFGLSPAHDAPRIARMSSAEMTNLFYENVSLNQRQAMRSDQKRPILVLYSIEKKTSVCCPSGPAGRQPIALFSFMKWFITCKIQAATFWHVPRQEKDLLMSPEQMDRDVLGTSRSGFAIDRLTILMTVHGLKPE